MRYAIALHLCGVVCLLGDKLAPDAWWYNCTFLDRSYAESRVDLLSQFNAFIVEIEENDIEV